MTERQFQRKCKRLEKQAKCRARNKQWQTLKAYFKPKKTLETSKLLAIYLFILLNAIVIYAMVMMQKTGDLSSLPVLISDIAAQVLVYAIYCAKAFKGKQAEEQVRFERDKLGLDDHVNDIEPQG